ncbi:hypothetical protein N7491_008390 [Penicillium cf. griseofulvum]|uniref:Uncharacterized protein n=1 Tax=Penicillium cf. griseofulvum TaxID=2972120 RepID=A0A9W9MGC8_9EURO|nr:hypothetical protein N7472_006008 [Penicillium cf. griseofulvum]KAJ5423174.1 hypothetical protein N7491_008390 [Penicillium cf. griseofulvum]KAJ5431559.1 hypothetical protein N7445_009291 [Penicillium cf. griseofulvum]
MEKKISVSTGLTKFPSAFAPADEVRTYITQVLINKYDVPVDVAEKHANKWEIGRFSQLTPASRDTIQRIFGDNVGLCIHSAVQEDLAEVMNQKPSAIISGYAATASSLSLATVLLLLFLPELGLQAKHADRIMWAASPVWWFLFAGSWGFYAIKHPLNEITITLSSLGAFAAIMTGVILLFI